MPTDPTTKHETRGWLTDLERRVLQAVEQTAAEDGRDITVAEAVRRIRRLFRHASAGCRKIPTSRGAVGFAASSVAPNSVLRSELDNIKAEIRNKYSRLDKRIQRIEQAFADEEW
jgi:hypothetical protein